MMHLYVIHYTYVVIFGFPLLRMEAQFSIILKIDKENEIIVWGIPKYIIDYQIISCYN